MQIARARARERGGKKREKEREMRGTDKSAPRERASGLRRGLGFPAADFVQFATIGGPGAGKERRDRVRNRC